MRNRAIRVGTALAVLGFLAVAVVGVVTGGSQSQDRAEQLSERLSCPECASVSIAESPSEIAQEMRIEVREQVEAGRSDEEILDYWRARYGDWVLHDPPTSGVTLPLWLVPAGATALGVLVVVLFRQHGRPQPEDELTSQQRERVSHALQQRRESTDEADDL